MKHLFIVSIFTLSAPAFAEEIWCPTPAQCREAGGEVSGAFCNLYDRPGHMKQSSRMCKENPTPEERERGYATTDDNDSVGFRRSDDDPEAE